MGRTQEVGDYIFKKEIGHGTFGTAFKGKHKHTNQVVVGKKIILDGRDYKRKKDLAEKEVEALQRVKYHPYVLQLIEHQVVEDDEDEDEDEDDKAAPELWIITDYCVKGNLSMYYQDHPVGISKALRFMKQMVNAVAFLHNIGIIHRDIKSSNILIKTDEGLDRVQVADFGLAIHYSGQTVTATKAGNMLHMSPQMLMATETFKYNPAVDVFALGALLELMLRAKPGESLDSLTVRNIGQKLLHDPSWNPVEDDHQDTVYVLKLKTLIRKMLQFEPTARPPMSEVDKQIAAISIPELGNKLQELTIQESSTSVGAASNAPLPREVQSSARVVRVTDDLSLQQCGGIMHLQQLTYSRDVGFGINGEILLGDKKKKTLALFDISGDKLSKLWEKPAPAGISPDCRKCVLPGGIMVLNDDRSKTTAVYSPELASCLVPPTRCDLLYGATSDGHTLHGDRGVCTVRDMNLKQVVKLTQPPRRTWGTSNSACSSPDGRTVIVTDIEGEMLEVFSHQGDAYPHQYHVVCNYGPAWGPNRVTCSDTHVFVLDYNRRVHVHQLERGGQHVAVITAAQLGVQQDIGIRWVGINNHNHLIMATGQSIDYEPYTEAIHVYKIN